MTLSKLFLFVVALLMASMPAATFAQEVNSVNQAIIDAKADADTSYIGWFSATFLTSVAFGCIGGSVIAVTSQVAPVNPPSYRLMGKPPAYIDAYTSTYKKQVQRNRLRNTSAGCVGGSAIAALIVVYTYPDLFSY